jgi:hypothetical protein
MELGFWAKKMGNVWGTNIPEMHFYITPKGEPYFNLTSNPAAPGVAVDTKFPLKSVVEVTHIIDAPAGYPRAVQLRWSWLPAGKVSDEMYQFIGTLGSTDESAECTHTDSGWQCGVITRALPAPPI